MRRFRNIEQAKAVLLSGEPVLNREALWHFNLACYDCQLGNLEEAKERLQKAFKLDANYRLMALDDEDLQPLWRSCEGLRKDTCS